MNHHRPKQFPGSARPQADSSPESHAGTGTVWLVLARLLARSVRLLCLERISEGDFLDSVLCPPWIQTPNSGPQVCTANASTH